WGPRWGRGREELAYAVVYDELQTVTSAALKLLPGDPLDSVAWILAAEPDAADAVATALAVTTPDTLPARTAPLTEQWALDHERSERRLFLA
ncbi:urease accessory protein, partial [Streptomyces sp. BpilaLS-43]